MPDTTLHCVERAGSARLGLRRRQLLRCETGHVCCLVKWSPIHGEMSAASCSSTRAVARARAQCGIGARALAQPSIPGMIPVCGDTRHGVAALQPTPQRASPNDTRADRTTVALTHSELQKATRMRYARLCSWGPGRARRLGGVRHRLARAFEAAKRHHKRVESGVAAGKIEVMTWLGTRSSLYHRRRRVQVFSARAPSWGARPRVSCKPTMTSCARTIAS
jgi:hypothetical protein